MAENKYVNTNENGKFCTPKNLEQNKEETVSNNQSPETVKNAEQTLSYIYNLKAEAEQFAKNYQLDNEKKEYKMLTEYLLQILLKLDSVETNNNDKIREARKSVVLYVQQLIDFLDLKSQCT